MSQRTFSSLRGSTPRFLELLDLLILSLRARPQLFDLNVFLFKLVLTMLNGRLEHACLTLRLLHTHSQTVMPVSRCQKYRGKCGRRKDLLVLKVLVLALLDALIMLPLNMLFFERALCSLRLLPFLHALLNLILEI